MVDFKKILGKRIKQLRLNADLTQVEVAKALGMTSTGTISQVENGERGLKRESIFKAASLFGVEPAVLMSEVDMTEEELRMHVAFSKLLRRKDKDSQYKSYYETIKRILL